MVLYSRTCAYAIRALTWLALRQPEGYLLAETLGRETAVPRPFLVKILQQLARHDLLVSARGRGGGFALERPASEITLREIVGAIDGEAPQRECVLGLSRCNEQQPCPHHDTWQSIGERIDRYLRQTTLAEMSRALAHKLEQSGAATPAEAIELER